MIQNRLDSEGNPPPRCTYSEFLAMCDGRHAEWVDGRIHFMSPASHEHQRLAAFLCALIEEFQSRAIGGTVIMAPFQMKGGEDLPGREPDLLWISPSREDQLRASYLDGPADLAVEIVSPESRHRDTVVKRDEYESAGVREYWVIDVEESVVRLHVLDRSGRYSERILRAGDELASHGLAGLRLPVRWMLCPANDRPSPVEAMRELGWVD